MLSNLATMGLMSAYHYLAQYPGKLEELAMERLRQHAKNGGALLRFQLAKFGVCPCECHTTPLVHASRPCCMQARLKSPQATAIAARHLR
jgi:hypothetical protein